MSAAEWIRTVAPLFTAFGVAVAVVQLTLNRRQARTSFEDDLSREYRSITRDLPPDAFHAQLAPDTKLTPEHRNAMFRYFDLSNEQLRVAEDGRVSTSTHMAWHDGIKDNMSLPRFRDAWTDVTAKLALDDNYFTWLREIVGEIERDPKPTA